jgi:hypothetical protein
MENWIKTQQGNYADISKAYFLEVGSAQKGEGLLKEWRIRAFFYSEEHFCILRSFKTEKEARDYLDGIMKKCEYMQFKERKK